MCAYYMCNKVVEFSSVTVDFTHLRFFNYMALIYFTIYCLTEANFIDIFEFIC